SQLLMRILGGDDEEWLRQPIGRGVRAHLPLLHRLEQRALCARARAVYFICQQQLCENRALAEMELVVGAVEYRYANDIRGQEVAGELHALPSETEYTGEGVCESSLADTGYVLDQQVSACQQAGQAQANLLGLSENYLLERAKRV